MANGEEELEFAKRVVDGEMLEFAQLFKGVLEKLKYSVDQGTRCLLLEKEVNALLTYLGAVATEWENVNSKT